MCITVCNSIIQSVDQVGLVLRMRSLVTNLAVVRTTKMMTGMRRACKKFPAEVFCMVPLEMPLHREGCHRFMNLWAYVISLRKYGRCDTAIEDTSSRNTETTAGMR